MMSSEKRTRTARSEAKKWTTQKGGGLAHCFDGFITLRILFNSIWYLVRNLERSERSPGYLPGYNHRISPYCLVGQR